MVLAVSSSILNPPWCEAYKRAGEPEGVLAPEEGYRLAELHLQSLKKEMRKVCGRFPAVELFFALRIMTPGAVRKLGLTFYEDANLRGATFRDATIGTIRLRRTASYAALLYGRPAPKDYLAIVGGTVWPKDLKRFVRAFVALMVLSRAYVRTAWGIRTTCSVGCQIQVFADGMSFLIEGREKLNVLSRSKDERGNRYFSPLSRIGEFGEMPLIHDPYEGPERDKLKARAGLFTARYEPDLRGVSGYRLGAYPLEALENLLWGLKRLNHDLAKAAWGMSFEEFAALLDGFCIMVKGRLADERLAEAIEVPSMVASAHRSATVPFLDSELREDGEGSLTKHAEAYATASCSVDEPVAS